MGRDQRRIRNLWLDWRFQGRYVGLLALSALGLSAVLTAAFYRFTFENYSVLVDLAPLTDAARLKLYREFIHAVWLMAGSSVLFTLVVVGLGIVFSHRTAGPMLQFRRVFREIAAGDRKARVRLRPGDDFQETAATFNTMMDELTRGPKP